MWGLSMLEANTTLARQIQDVVDVLGVGDEV